eukprot:gene16861-18563_t
MGDLPLQFHEFKHLDHTKRCSKYSALLTKPASGSIQPNELDEIYTDLESLLGAANIRHRQLESELKILSEWADKKDKKSLLEIDLLTQFAGKRSSKSAVEEKPAKKQKTEELKTLSSKIKGKGSGKGVKCESDPEVYVSKPKAAPDAPNKFWAAVEPYCADITMDDLKVLEDIINSPTDDSEYFKVPPLGKHYTKVWAQEDFKEEKREGSKYDKRRSGSTLNANSDNVDFEKKAKQVDMNSVTTEEEHCPFGPLTQRLISALVDENILAPMDESELSESSKVNLNNDQGSAVQHMKNFTIPHVKALENAIKDELVNLGLIDPQSDEEGEVDVDDEVLLELKRHQSELRTVMQKNKCTAEALLVKAQKEMQKQELKQRAKVIDAEVMDAFRRITAAKQKKKSISKKEKDNALKSLRDRESILKLLDSQK